MTDTPEYRTLVQCNQALILAVQSDVVNLSHQLLSAGLIAADVVDHLRNESRSVSERSARLVHLIKRKVETDQRNYEIFLDILQRSHGFESTIQNLNETYRKLSGK